MVRILSVVTSASIAACAIAADNPFFSYKVMARAGQNGLTGFEPAMSINDKGEVAFVGQTQGVETPTRACLSQMGWPIQRTSPRDLSRTSSTSVAASSLTTAARCWRGAGGGGRPLA